VSLGEDAGQQRAGNIPQALAALRNGVLSLLRSLGWANIADALRRYGALCAARAAPARRPPGRTLTPPWRGRPKRWNEWSAGYIMERLDGFARHRRLQTVMLRMVGCWTR
jgi:hypothetical protein